MSETSSPNHKDRAHSKWGCSVMHRYFECPGSVNFCKDIADKPSAFAAEGTQAHELLEVLLRCHLGGNDGADVHEAQEHLARASKDMQDAVDVAYHYVLDLLEEHADAVLILEHKFEIPSLVAPGEVFGTNDIIVYVPSLRLLYVIDYKHGAGVFVDVNGNVQLRGYAVGALYGTHDFVVDTVALVIIQPRYPNAKPIRDEWISEAELRQFHADMDMKILAAKKPDAPLVPGAHQCKFCPGTVTCPAREKQALAVVGDTFGDVREVVAGRLPNVGELTPDRVAHVLQMAGIVEDWFSAVRKHGFALAQNGVSIPGFKLVEAAARRSFGVTDDEPMTYAISEELSKITDGRVAAAHFREVSLIGVGEAEKLLKADARKQVEGQGKAAKDAVLKAVTDRFAFLTTKKSSGTLSLVSDSDPRPAYDPKSTAFADVKDVPLLRDDEGS